MLETPRLRLRPLEQRDLPRFPEFLNDWDVAKWLSRAPYPYTIENAKKWYAIVMEESQNGFPAMFVLAAKENDLLIGTVGFHIPAVPEPEKGEVVLGYWLAKPHWGQGLMSEAVTAALPLAWKRPDINKITSFTDINNTASQNVLRKAGLHYLGIYPRVEQGHLRGSNTVTRWEMTRQDYVTSFPTTRAV